MFTTEKDQLKRRMREAVLVGDRDAMEELRADLVELERKGEDYERNARKGQYQRTVLTLVTELEILRDRFAERERERVAVPSSLSGRAVAFFRKRAEGRGNSPRNVDRRRVAEILSDLPHALIMSFEQEHFQEAYHIDRDLRLASQMREKLVAIVDAFRQIGELVDGQTRDLSSMKHGRILSVGDEVEQTCGGLEHSVEWSLGKRDEIVRPSLIRARDVLRSTPSSVTNSDVEFVTTHLARPIGELRSCELRMEKRFWLSVRRILSEGAIPYVDLGRWDSATYWLFGNSGQSQNATSLAITFSRNRVSTATAERIRAKT